MPETLIIADTSCLILLSKINELGLLKASYSKIVVTPQIALEFEEVVPYWIEVIEVKNTILQSLLNSQPPLHWPWNFPRQR